MQLLSCLQIPHQQISVMLGGHKVCALRVNRQSDGGHFDFAKLQQSWIRVSSFLPECSEIPTPQVCVAPDTSGHQQLFFGIESESRTTQETVRHLPHSLHHPQ